MASKIKSLDLEKSNLLLRNKDPFEIINWALTIADRPILTTNFGPFSASLIYAVNQIKQDIKVIWCDTGYNTPFTYRYAHKQIESLSLNMHIYVPNQTSAFRDITMRIPDINTKAHEIFTKEVKLDPFKKALKEHNPDVWFTNLRKEQTSFRNNLDIVSINKEGILKVCPFFYYSEFEMELFLKKYDLTNETRYYDPTKVLEKRECGLHL